MWELFRELLKVDSYFKRGYIGQNQKICCTCKNQRNPPKKFKYFHKLVKIYHKITRDKMETGEVGEGGGRKKMREKKECEN